MYPRSSYKIIINNNYSSLGDTICSLPVIRALKRDNALHQIITPEHYLSLYKQILPEHKIVTLESIVNKDVTPGKIVTVTYDAPCPVINITTDNNTFVSDRIHLVDYFSILLAKTILLPDEKNYPRIKPKTNKFNLPLKYVVVHTSGTALYKILSEKAILKILHYIKKLNYTPVVTGLYGGNYLSDNVPVFDNLKNVPDFAIDLRNKTLDIMDLHAVISNSNCFVGVDSGAMHVAGLTDVPIIAGFTFQRPEYLMPIRNKVLGWKVTPIVPPQTSCRFCLSNRLYPVWEYKDEFACMKKTNECGLNLPVKEFIRQLDVLLK